MVKDVALNEYLKTVRLSEDLLKIADIDPESILEEYIKKYLNFKLEQEKKSKTLALPVQETNLSNKIDFSNLEDFDKWIVTPEYKIYLSNIISKLRTIGFILGPECITSLTLDNKNNQFNKTNIYRFDFFTKQFVHPNFLTLQRILYTFGFNYQIFSYEFKKFFTCGHRLIGLIGTNKQITMTWNVDTLDEFFKKLLKLEEACVSKGIKYLYEEFKILFGKFKSYVIGLIIKSAINPWHILKYKINLCLQECDEDLYIYLKNELKEMFIGSIFCPQNSKIFEIDDFINFSLEPKQEKIILKPNNSTHGLVTFTNMFNKISSIQVFNSLVLSHEKKSKKRGLTYTNRGVYIPEINLYNLHLKSICAYSNLVSLEKYHFENDVTQYDYIYLLNYSFTSGSYTQMYGVLALANKYPNLTFEQIHNIIDIIYERKIQFDQVLIDILRIVPKNVYFDTNQLINIFSNLKIGFKEKYYNLFEQVDYNKFIQAVNIHWLKSYERLLCKELMDQAVNDLLLVNKDNFKNPDIIIKEFCSKQVNINCKLTNQIMPSNITNLIICGDVNIILIDLNGTRIKKYSFKSEPSEDEPFNHLLNMQMNSWGNDVIFIL